ncbi:pyridoxamine 5-phosphate oxidase [Prauserella sp. PE36]|uniref:Pyridoxamine 5-phosphate oxidase n=1 Tax=Prauserella endophytica TaxID=1592324 RepID=A0ABY2S304_9PSEU|nr:MULTISPECIES: pyridoxamine 5'-phosphate oxidase family protein [Prauserella]PXY29953.1 pyridoxamine 5-phosphate oxidase [Prauserella coralliicola]RBM11524.1 pyridoxamine 5-phosphate oxidase [Prauserella sp. PE36]TKG69748.1 pyridoxamine 5-phosphate oxidase [Prauserella endophytica]
MRRDEVFEVMDKPISRELLGSSIPARFSYVGLDGGPRVVPIGFHWTGAELVMSTVPTSAKVKALRANPRVAITIDTDSFPPRVLLVRGSAHVEDVEGVPDEYITAARKVVPDDEFAGWEAGVRALYQRMTRIIVTPGWAKLLDFETTLPKSVEDLMRARQG